jgi:hypothetical protein
MAAWFRSRQVAAWLIHESWVLLLSNPTDLQEKEQKRDCNKVKSCNRSLGGDNEGIRNRELYVRRLTCIDAADKSTGPEWISLAFVDPRDLGADGWDVIG